VITSDVVVFPNNIVNLWQTRVQALDADLKVVRRPLRSSDPIQSVGIVPVEWVPDPDSAEMRGQGNVDMSLNTYTLGIQAFVKDGDEERGLATHSVLSKMIRSMLYRDAVLRLGLAALSVTMDGSTERTQRWGIRTQRYVSNEIDGAFLYLSTLEFWLETETT
jgi:hypothetical protein